LSLTSLLIDRKRMTSPVLTGVTTAMLIGHFDESYGEAFMQSGVRRTGQGLE